jgi:hypothetical protein
MQAVMIDGDHDDAAGTLFSTLCLAALILPFP